MERFYPLGLAVVPAEEVDPRIRRSREALQTALFRLMQDQPYNNISVSDIVRQAGVNRSTFYAHYQDKDDLFRDCLRRSFQRLLEARLPVSDQFCRGDIRQLVIVTGEYLADLHRDCTPADRVLDPLVETHIQAQLYDYILGWLQTSQAQGFRLQAQPETVATMMSWMIFGVGMRWRHQPDPVALARIGDEVYTVLLSGAFAD